MAGIASLGHAQQPQQQPTAPQEVAPAPVQSAPVPAPQPAAPPVLQYEPAPAQPVPPPPPQFPPGQFQQAPPPSGPLPPQSPVGPEGSIPPEAVPPAEPPLPSAVGKVIEVNDQLVTISLGAGDGLQIGSHVAFLDAGEDDVQWMRGAETTVVGTVTNLAEDRARVTIGMFEHVRVGGRAQVTAARLSESRVAPPRPDGTLLFELGVRPFLPLKRVSVGAFADLALTYLPQLPMFVRAEVSPLGGRIGAGGDAGVAGGSVTFGYDQRFVAIGLGAGTVLFRRFVADDSGDVGQLGSAVPRFVFLQQGRIGSRDGLHLQATSAFALVDESWQLGWLRLSGQFRVGARGWVSPRFMIGPRAGLFSAEAGVRILARGDGGSGSLFVRPLAGFAGTFDPEDNRLYRDDVGIDGMLFGPMVGLDVEWRL